MLKCEHIAAKKTLNLLLIKQNAIYQRKGSRIYMTFKKHIRWYWFVGHVSSLSTPSSPLCCYPKFRLYTSPTPSLNERKIRNYYVGLEQFLNGGLRWEGRHYRRLLWECKAQSRVLISRILELYKAVRLLILPRSIFVDNLIHSDTDFTNLKAYTNAVKRN